METLIQILTALALLGASALCIFLIVVLLRLNTVLKVLQTELVDLNRNLRPLLENLGIVAEKLRQIATKVDDQVNMVHGVFVAFKRITDNVTRFEERFQQRLEEPLMRVSSLFGSIINRVISFFTRRAQELF